MTTSKNSSSLESQSSYSQENKGSKRLDSYSHGINRVVKTKMLISFLILFMIFDYMTKSYLFEISVRHELIIRTEYRKEIYDKLFKWISELGDKYACGVMIFVAYQTLDLPKSFIVILEAIICQSFSSILKAIYHEPRPFFVSDIKPNQCRFEFGNPSGHSFIAIGLYFTFWDLLCRQYKASTAVKRLTMIPIIIIVILIAMSRIYNGVHTYNQVFSGLIWGLITYFTVCHVFYFEICVFINKIQQKGTFDLIWNTITQIFVGAYAIAVALYFFNLKMNPVPLEWLQAIERNCVQTEGQHVDAEVSNFIQFNFCWGLIGAYIGLIVEQKLMPTRHYHYFFKTSFVVFLQRSIASGFLGAVTQLPVFLVSKRNPFWIVLIFKTILPIFVGNLYIFGFSKYIAFKLGLINTEILSKKDLDRETKTGSQDRSGSNKKIKKSK